MTLVSQVEKLIFRNNKAHHSGRALVLISTNHWVITGASEVVLGCSFVSFYEDWSLFPKSLKELGCFSHWFWLLILLVISQVDITFAFRNLDNVSRNQ